jgi:putative transposase
MIALALPFVALLGVVTICKALGLSRATWYRMRGDTNDAPRTAPEVPGEEALRGSARRLSDAEEQRILDAMHEDRFVDKAPAEVYATLLDEGIYVGSIRTFYRVLNKHKEVRERRAIRSHPNYRRPELLAVRPNELWSWDITKLRGPTRGTYFYLYVILDVFSRYVVGWMVAMSESTELAKELIAECYDRQGVEPGQLTLHADRGSSMTSHGVAHLLTGLGVEKSHSRPYVSDDNPYSEAQFKTLKYRPNFPARFGCLEDARAFCRAFFDWYNHEHHHSGLALLTPSDVHHGRVEARVAARDAVLAAAHAAHPERFVHGQPHAHRPPTTVWINPPKVSSAGTQDGPPSCAPKEPGGCGGTTPAQPEGAH